MKLKRCFVICLLVVFSMTNTFTSASDRDSVDEDYAVDQHNNKPRFFGMFSKPKTQSEPRQGYSLTGHMGGVIKGGLAPIHGLIDHKKKFIHSLFNKGLTSAEHQPDKTPYVPEPHPHEPQPKPYVPPPKPYVPKPKPHVPDHGSIESEKPDYWQPHEPLHPVKPDESIKPEQPKPVKPSGGSKWDDIGEEPEDYVTEAIEDIIQPRNRRLRRPKRFLESKLYKVPLEFLSNAKPYQIQLKRENEV